MPEVNVAVNIYVNVAATLSGCELPTQRRCRCPQLTLTLTLTAAGVVMLTMTPLPDIPKSDLSSILPSSIISEKDFDWCLYTF